MGEQSVPEPRGRLPESREERLRCYINALRNWRLDGYVRFKKIAEQWLMTEIPDLPLIDVRRQLHEFVEYGGTIDEQVEKRPEYTHYEFHFDLRLKIGSRRVYFETVLLGDDFDDPDDPSIFVVSIHDA